jgi:CRP-like cAMP-binding protein
LRQQVFAFHSISDEAWADFSPLWAETEVKRKQVLTRIGETEQYIYLVLDGVQRACYTHHNKDVTLVFSYAPSFSGIIDSFFLQQPSAYQLETLTDSHLLRISYHSFSRAMQQHRCLETWVRHAMTMVLAGTLQRQIELAAFTAEEKFTALLRRSPHVLNLIPHKYLASYIGVDPTNFSKLLNTVRL